MKKVFYTALLVMGLSVSTFAANDYSEKKEAKVASSLQAKFENTYAGATNVTWTVTDKFQKASFNLDGVQMTAFYDLNNDYVATTHATKADKLSAVALERIAKTYKGYEIGKVIAYDNGSKVLFVDLKKGEKEVLVRVMPNNSIYFFKQLN